MPISPTSLDAVEFNSKNERDILLIARRSNLFKNESTWLYYSLKINETGTAKIVGESDFVYFDSTHLLFLEVKGGEVRYDSLNDRWLVMGGSKEKDPFKQCASLMFQVRDILIPKLFDGKKISDRLIFGYGTMFPESIKPREMRNHVNGTIEYHADLIYDCYDFVSPQGLAGYINRLKSFWTSRHAHKQQAHTGISYKEQKTISDYFRVNLHFQLPPSIIVDRERETLKHFTSFQSFILDNIELNPNSGAIIVGGPGTGKTLLATELALQRERNNQTVLLICFNKNLAAHLRQKLDTSSVKVIHLHGLYSELMTLNKWHYDGDEENLFDQALPLFILQKMESLDFRMYDYLIIDEGQDLLNEYHLDVLDRLLKGGFKSGKWSLFIDILNQNIYNRKYAQEYLNFFRDTYPNFINSLKVNCRNTTNIINYAHLLTSLPPMPCLRTDNYYKCQSKYGNSYGEIISEIAVDIHQLCSQNESIKGSITILCYSSDQIQMVMKSDIKAVLFESGCEGITVSSIQGFKGLENSYVYIIGPEKYFPEDENQMSILYIGVTRATTRCVVYFLSDNRESLVSQVEKISQLKMT